MNILAVIIGGLLALAGSFVNSLINRNSEERKKELEIKHTKLAIVFENQKVAFKSLIQAMYKVQSAIQQPYDQAWEPTSGRIYDDFIEVLNEEALFIDSESEKALRLFGSIIGETAFYEHPPPSDREIRNSYEQLEYLSESIREYFRSRVGVSKEPNITIDLDLLKVCRFICQENFEKEESINFEIIKLSGSQSPVDLLSLAREDLTLFRKEFQRYIEFLKTNPKKSKFYLSKVEEAEKYYNKIFKV